MLNLLVVADRRGAVQQLRLCRQTCKGTFPESGKIDKTLGFGSVLYYDPVYSTDVINNLYNTRNEYIEAANGYKVSERKGPLTTRSRMFTMLTSIQDSRRCTEYE